MDTAELRNNLGKRFLKKRNGLSEIVYLREVRRSKVTVQIADRVDRFSLSISEFTKFYRPVDS